MKSEAGQIAGGAAEPAVPLPAVGGGHRLHLEHPEPGPANPANEVHVFHQRQRPITSDLAVKCPRDEKPLVPVRQPQHPHARRNPALDDASLPGVAVEPEAEASRSPGRSVDVSLDGCAPAHVQPGVGVKEKQPIAGGRLAARPELSTPAPCRRDQPRALCSGDGLRSVGGAAINDNDLRRPVQPLQARGKRRRGIQRRNDNRKVQPEQLAPPSTQKRAQWGWLSMTLVRDPVSVSPIANSSS